MIEGGLKKVGLITGACDIASILKVRGATGCGCYMTNRTWNLILITRAQAHLMH